MYICNNVLLICGNLNKTIKELTNIVIRIYKSNSFNVLYYCQPENLLTGVQSSRAVGVNNGKAQSGLLAAPLTELTS